MYRTVLTDRSQKYKREIRKMRFNINNSKVKDSGIKRLYLTILSE
jgi:hypothetical protein